MAAVENAHWWFVARRRILSEVLRREVVLPRDARLLEAGCGTGGNLAMLAGFGEVCAFEPEPEARRRAVSKTGIEVRDGHLPERVPFGDGSFDLVAALDVLEHVKDDLGSLRALRRKLRPGGWILLTVPAFPFLWSRHDESHHHQRRYRRDDLLEVIAQAGLIPVKVTYFNSLLFPAIVGVRVARNLLGFEGADDDALPPPLLNRLLEIAFASERHLIGRAGLPLGVSLLAIARATGSDDVNGIEAHASKR
ncbi:MAG: class I SAM-dependent methyltransferase [Rhodospirillales bacterium]|nr:class I SAM-dependent methyltransferase [Rhodospirillales bacterium]